MLKFPKGAIERSVSLSLSLSLSHTHTHTHIRLTGPNMVL